MTEVTSIEGGVQAGEWTMLFATDDEDFRLQYRGSLVDVPAGYDMLLFALAKRVSDQDAALDELADDPDVAVPASTRDDEAAIKEVARIAVDAVIDPWLNTTDLVTVLADNMAKHFASLLCHYSRRTENLMRERDGLHLVLQDSRSAEWEAAQNSGYWHKRCCYAEAALQPLADCYEAIAHMQGADESMGTISVQLDDVRQAHQILAEMRKDGQPGGSYEQYVRDRRQAKIFDWADRTFTTEDFDATDLEERAFRFLEEALELWQSAMDKIEVAGRNGEPFSYSAQHGFFRSWMFEAYDKLHRLIDRVLRGDPGEIGREYGGTMVTAACLAQVTGHSLCLEEQREFTRVVGVSRDVFQARHQVKRDAGI